MTQGGGRSAPSVTEAQLQAYVDGQLGTGDRAAVETYLAANPAEHARIAEYIRQNRQIGALFDKHAAAPLPERIKELGEDLAQAVKARRER